MQQLKTGFMKTYSPRKKIKISIVVPTYEAKGKGVYFTKRCLDSIKQQTYTNYEVIIADHSIDSDIRDALAEYSGMKIKHFFNERGRGNSSINMNEGIKKAKGDVIKILHFDDQLSNPNSLKLLADLYKNKEVKWGAFGFNHLYGNIVTRELIPSFSNTMGCPSTSFFINDKTDPIYFDENLIIINDHDMHHRLRSKYGEPNIIEDICVTIGMHTDQVSNSDMAQEKELKEWDYYRTKQYNK